MERIDDAIRRLWSGLISGQRFDLPGDEVEHPEDRPDIFSQPPAAWPVGQSCDHVWRLADGSRVHAQCMKVGGGSVIRIHRDKYDPAHSFAHFVLHGATETPIGPVLGAVALAWAASALIEGS
jgi:hypothetical protein